MKVSEFKGIHIRVEDDLYLYIFKSGWKDIEDRRYFVIKDTPYLDNDWNLCGAEEIALMYKLNLHELKEQLDTLDQPKQESGIVRAGRVVGNTTRQADAFIQAIMESGHIVHIRDHYMQGNHNLANKMLYRTIMERLFAEHQGLRTQLIYDNDELTIELKK